MIVKDILPFEQDYVEVVDDMNMTHIGFIANLDELKHADPETSDIQLHLVSGLTYDYLPLAHIVSIEKTSRQGR